jgi:hypothetical protein
MAEKKSTPEPEPAVVDEAHRAAQSGSLPLLTKILEQIGMQAGAKAVFGEPVERDGRTVVPVAQTMMGVGAGSGDSDEAGSGAGAGGGALSRPLGYIEISQYGTEFVPLRRPWQDPGFLLAAAFATLLLAKALRTLLRG